MNLDNVNKDVAKELKWRVTDIFPSDEAWEKEFKALETEYSLKIKNSISVVLKGENYEEV